MEESNYKKLHDLPDPVWQPERSLWCAVVGQVVIDAASTDQEIRQEVIDWVQSEDSSIVCGMAGLRHQGIIKVVNDILYDPDRKNAFRTAMTFKLTLKNWVESHYGTVDTKGS